MTSKMGSDIENPIDHQPFLQIVENLDPVSTSLDWNSDLCDLCCPVKSLTDELPSANNKNGQPFSCQS